MSVKEKFHHEHLRPAEYICEPDPRSDSFVTVDDNSGRFRPLKVKDYHERISIYKLKKSVPEGIVIQLETAKNLYLYAWFIYRFYPVCEHQALSCLEFALRERYGNEIPEEYVPKGRKPTLGPLLKYAVDRGYIENQGFKRWHDAAEIRARSRYEIEKIKEMQDKGLERIELDYDDVEVVDKDRDWEYINALIKRLPKLRNRYAHGSKMLHNQVLRTIQAVSEIINQIY